MGVYLPTIQDCTDLATFTVRSVYDGLRRGSSRAGKET
jgi:hypothetical protein